MTKRPGVRKELRSRLRARKSVKKRKPSFRRQEGYRLRKLKKTWRRPKGRHSKLRKREKGKSPQPGPWLPESGQEPHKAGLPGNPGLQSR
jgi:large subunit ribosomal protein L32e